MNTGDLHCRTSHKCGLELGEEGEQIGIVPPAFPSRWLVLFAHAERLCFHIKVRLGVDIGGVERDMPQPRTDGVDVYSSAEKVRCGRVVDGVRADILLLHFGHGDCRSSRMACDDVVDAEARQRFRYAAQEHAFVIFPPACHLTQCVCGRSPQWAESDFISFTLQPHRR
jgi:hypothetical protein